LSSSDVQSATFGLWHLLKNVAFAKESAFLRIPDMVMCGSFTIATSTGCELAIIGRCSSSSSKQCSFYA
jgi:hypothetical protein